MADEEFVAGLEQFSGIATNYTPGAEFDVLLDETVKNFREGRAAYDTIRQEMFEKYVR